MVRELTKNDYTEDEILNLKNGKCWCGKPRSEFDKGMRVYCSKEHRENWYLRTAYWSTVREQFLAKNGKKCNKCGLDYEIANANLEERQKKWKKEILADPRSKILLERERIDLLKRVEEDYENAMDDEFVFDRVFDRFSNVDGFPRKPDKYNEDLRFEVDHIIAVALGGDQWDEKNFQVLCTNCHKEKTALDMKKIKAKRRKLKPLDQEMN